MNLIAVSLMLDMKSSNPLGLASEAEYEISMVTRAYVGRFRGYDAMSADEFGSLGDAVFIFPKRGEKYHSEGCRHLKAHQLRVRFTCNEDENTNPARCARAEKQQTELSYITSPQPERIIISEDVHHFKGTI